MAHVSGGTGGHRVGTATHLLFCRREHLLVEVLRHDPVALQVAHNHRVDARHVEGRLPQHKRGDKKHNPVSDVRGGAWQRESRAAGQAPPATPCDAAVALTMAAV